MPKIFAWEVRLTLRDVSPYVSSFKAKRLFG
jgi:hypothetical protein